MKTFKENKLLALILTIVLVVAVLPSAAFASNGDVTTTIPVGVMTVQFGDPAYTATSPEQDMRFVEGSSPTAYAVTYNGSITNFYPDTLALYITGITTNSLTSLVASGGVNFLIEDTTSGSQLSPTPDNLTAGYYILKISAAGTLTINNSVVLSFSAPNNPNSGDGPIAALPAPGQFTNEGINTGGWGSPYNSNGTIKGMQESVVSTGLSLGYFGGYAVFDFGGTESGGVTTAGNLTNYNKNPYGVDFIVYGNAFNGNSEPGNVQVSLDGQVWYDIAGSMHYDSTTDWDYTLTYVNPTPSDNPTGTTGTRVAVPYYINNVATNNGTVAINGWHNHSWFPLHACYFNDRTVGSVTYRAIANTGAYPFADYKTNQTDPTNTVSGTTELLSLSGVHLGGISALSGTGSAEVSYGYFDCHPNGSNTGTAVNPYTAGASSSGGDGMDLAWTVYAAGSNEGTPGEPVSSTILDKGFRYVRVYNGVGLTISPFGEVSPEVCGVVTATPNGSSVGSTTTHTVKIRGNDIESLYSQNLVSKTTIGVVDVYDATSYLSGYSSFTVKASGNTGAATYINSSQTGTLNSVANTSSTDYVRVIVQEGSAAPYIALIKF